VLELPLERELDDLLPEDDRELDPLDVDALDRSRPAVPLAMPWVVPVLESLDDSVVRCFGVVDLVVGVVAECDVAPVAAPLWPELPLVAALCDPVPLDRVPCEAEPADAE
jgi:hypothetical protein